MTIMEALAAANWIERPIVCRQISDGYTMAIRFENRNVPLRALFREDCRLSRTEPWMPRKSDILSDRWEIFDPAQFRIPEPEASQPEPDPIVPNTEAEVKGLLELPATSAQFRAALADSSDAAVYSAADRLEEMRKSGLRCKTRLWGVNQEIARREKGRGQGER